MPFPNAPLSLESREQYDTHDASGHAIADPADISLLPLVSVIVPARNRSDALRKCLRSLRRQTYPSNRYEILLVDNDSEENLREVCSEFEGVTYLSERAVGSYAARNTGIRAARGEIIAFTDSDCVAAPDWLERGVQSLTTLQCDIVGGRIEYVRVQDRPLNIFEVFEETQLKLARQEFFVRHNHAVTANVITFRSSFDRAGFYDASMRAAGDKEWANRAVGTGLALKYSAEAVVYHPRRSTHREIMLVIKRGAGGQQQLKLKRKQWMSALIDIVADSPLSPKIPLFVILCPGVHGLLDRLRFGAAVYHYSLVATMQRIKVTLGGKVFRGD